MIYAQSLARVEFDSYVTKITSKRSNSSMAKMEIASKTESKGECFVTKESECKYRSNAYRSLRPK